MKKFLGNSYFSTWSFIQLITLYFTHANFGIPNALTNNLAIHFNKKKFIYHFFNNSIFLFLVLSLLTIVLFILSSQINFGSKYEFYTYSFLTCLTIIFNYFNVIFLNTHRVYSNFKLISIYQAISPSLILILIFFFRGEQLLKFAVYSLFFSSLFSLLLFIIWSPIKITPKFNKSIAKKIINEGFFLFVYNLSFYFIFITTRTLIGYYFSKEIFAEFSFAFSIAAIITLILDSILFIIFPKLVSKFHQLESNKTLILMQNIRLIYSTLSSIITYSLCSLLLVISKYNIEYQFSVRLFVMIAMTNLIFTNANIFTVYLMSQKKYKELALIASFSLLFNIFAFLIINTFLNEVIFDLIATIVTYFIFSFGITFAVKKHLQINTQIKIYTLNFMIPFLSFVSLAFFYEVSSLTIIVLFTIYLLLNFKNFIKTKKELLKLLKNPNLAEL